MDVEAALAEVVDVRTRHAAAKVMVAFGGLLMIALLITYRRWLVPARGRGLATVGTALAAVGLAANSLSQAAHGYLLYWASAPEVDPSAGVDVVSAAESATAPVTLPVSFWSVPCSPSAWCWSRWRCGERATCRAGCRSAWSSRESPPGPSAPVR